MSRTPIYLSWSSGKDSAWTLYQLQHHPTLEVRGLLTTFNEAFDRVAMHAVRRTLTQAQARAADLPLYAVDLPWPCSNEAYEARMGTAVATLKAEGIRGFAFGDLFLEDVRAYREAKLEGTGLQSHFPLWRKPTEALAREMVEAGVKATLTCVDPGQAPADWAGRSFDHELIEDCLKAGIDPCGERGEFHTFVSDGPMFTEAIAVTTGEIVERDGFIFADILPKT
ncbi:ATP-binding protein [Pokkaliibacter sp. CJK22405]|uniref:Dph6-related ATP pyrophosphatase n=1 Tax=Pokkaliibacter sp. CJK22405 TaxID=3384615 RepID=UPI003984817B